MKPLLSRPVTRECKNLGEWEPASHQLTDDGRNAFAARQRARMEAAKKARDLEALETFVVRPITKRKA